MSTVACPVCGLTLDEKDILRQKCHMEAHHPEVIYARLRREGLWDEKNHQPYYAREGDPLIGYRPTALGETGSSNL
jgi:hypothetical protein